MVFLFSSSLSPNSTYLNLPFTLDVPLSHSGSQDNHIQITTLRSAILKIAKIFQSAAFLSNYTNNFIILKSPVCKKNPMWLPIEMFYITKCLWCTVCYREYYGVTKITTRSSGLSSGDCNSSTFCFFCPEDSWSHLLQHHFPHSRFMCMSRGEKIWSKLGNKLSSKEKSS